MPKLSIITINYNNLTGLQKTMESVFTQSFADYEYIIIDGGSTDGSKEYIEQHKSRLAYWVSEKDQGVYDAMNKGIAKARGEYLLMLNSGDYLCSDVLTHIPWVADLVYGDVIWELQDGTRHEHHFPGEIQFSYFLENSLGHQAAFIKKSLHESVGLYDAALAFVSDWKFFMLALTKDNASYKHIDVNIAVCGRDGASCDPDNWEKILEERKSVMKENFNLFCKDYQYHESLRHEINQIKRSFWFRVVKRLGLMALAK